MNNLIARIQGDIDKLTSKFGKYKKGGFGFTEMARFALESGATLVTTVEGVKGATGREKKDAVVSAVKSIYRKINPDIPWVPEPLETMIENLVLDKILPAFIDVLVGILKAKGIFK